MSNNFRVATFNLFNLVAPNTPYYGRRMYTKEIFVQKKAWICGQLQNMHADIVGFQEVFHEEALKEVLDESGLYKNAHILTAEPKGKFPAVGLVSRFPIQSHEVMIDFPEILDYEGLEIPIRQFRRPILKAELEIKSGFNLTCFVIHLKSKRPLFTEAEERKKSDPIARAKGQARALILRAAEATAMRTILVKHMQNTTQPVIVLGDVNDTGLAVTSRILSGENPFRNMPQNKKKAIWDVLLYHAKDVQARKSFHDFYYTHIHNGHYESLDHIMVSEELVQENPNRLGRIGYVRVLNDHLIDETLSGQRVKSWQSDHGQVVATIELKP